MRPLIAAEPMLRAPMPENVPESRVAAPAWRAGGAELGGVLSGPLGTTTRVSGWPAVGILYQASSLGTSISARSTVTRNPRGAPLPPDSTENGIHRPATCW